MWCARSWTAAGRRVSSPGSTACPGTATRAATPTPRHTTPSTSYLEQLRELWTNDGPLVEVWFDGAGSAGHRYDWPRIMRAVRELQPDAVVFSMGDPDIRWGCNETGFGSPDLWTVVDPRRHETVEDAALLHEPGVYLPAEMDTAIHRAGWCWHEGSQAGVRPWPSWWVSTGNQREGPCLQA